MLITATAQPGGDLAKVEAAINEELARFLKDGPTPEELERVKTQYRARFIRGIERIGGFGGKSDILVQGEVFAGHPDFYKTRLDRVAQRHRRRHAARAPRTGSSDGVYILEVHPFPDYKPRQTGVDRSKLPEVTTFPDLDLPETRKATLSNGLKVVLAERHEIPIVDFELLVDAGYAADQFAAPGHGQPDDGHARRGHQDALGARDQRSARSARRESAAPARTSIPLSVSLSALNENLDPSLDIFADVHPESDLPAGRLRAAAAAAAGPHPARKRPSRSAWPCGCCPG